MNASRYFPSAVSRTVFASLFVLACGIPPLVNSVGNPRLAGLHGPDILRLIAIGFCAGLALGVFLVGFLGGRESFVTSQLRSEARSCLKSRPRGPFHSSRRLLIHRWSLVPGTLWTLPFTVTSNTVSSDGMGSGSLMMCDFASLIWPHLMV